MHKRSDLRLLKGTVYVIVTICHTVIGYARRIHCVVAIIRAIM